MTETFLKEKKYLQNVSPRTIELYAYSFQAFAGALDSEEQIKQRVCEMRDRGLSPVTVNTYLRHLKCYYLWQKKPWTIPALKEKQTILATFSSEQIKRVIYWKPVRRGHARIHALALTALDTGLRIDELLSLTRPDLDFDNLCIRVHGKGDKERLVPMSIELRKLLWRHLGRHHYPFVFPGSDGGKMNQRNALRDFKSCAASSALPVCGVVFTR